MKTTVLLTTALLAACATASSAGASPSSLYDYQDGVRRPLTVVPGLVAEVGSEHAMQAAMPSAEVVHSGGNATIYKAPAADLDRAVKSSAMATAKLSPVYREGNSPIGRLMALPGGVVVNFKADWTEAQVQAWAASRKLTLEKRLPLTGVWYVVATAPGQASLTTANAIHESGTVLSASPNWWKQTVTK